MYKSVSPEEALKIVKSNNRIYIQAAAAAPQALIRALTARADELHNVEICHLHTEGPAPYANPKLSKSFHVNSFFVGGNVRHTLKAGNGSFTPVFLSELPSIFRNGILTLDIALIQVSTPDKHGYCSLGTTVAATPAAIESAKLVIAQVNPQMPRTHGDGIIHISELDIFVEFEEPIFETKISTPNKVEKQIGKYIANLIEDRSTLQMGIGNIPNAVLEQLGNHKDLGIHSEMISDGVIDLILKDVINGNYKTINPGKALITFLMGTKRLYDYVDDNPYIEMRGADFVNNVSMIMQNPKMVAINSAVEVDLTGQVCADSIGPDIYSGPGGQMDFIRGASLSKGGKAIIALPAITNKGISRIAPFLKPGAGVVTTRSHVQYIVTEYGVALLSGKTIKQRIQALAQIAHPELSEDILRFYYDKKIGSPRLKSTAVES